MANGANSPRSVPLLSCNLLLVSTTVKVRQFSSRCGVGDKYSWCLLFLPLDQDLNERLKKLVNSASVMIFMKGNQSSPKCGFSRQLMEIIQPLNIPFETFDILEDEDVRQGKRAGPIQYNYGSTIDFSWYPSIFNQILVTFVNNFWQYLGLSSRSWGWKGHAPLYGLKDHSSRRIT